MTASNLPEVELVKTESDTQEKKEVTPSFTATIRLETNGKQEQKIWMLSDCGRQLYNACLGESLKRLEQVKRTKLYKETVKLSKTDKKEKAQRTKNFKTLNNKFGFNDASIQSFGVKAKNDSKFIGKHLGVHVCQKIATRSFRAVQKVALKKAKKVRFKRKGEFVSLEGKNNKTFLTYSNGYVFVGDLTLKCLIDPKDRWMQHALKQRIKYCRLIAKKVKGKYRFYIQLTLEGYPYQKCKMGEGTTGIDIGPSSMAVVGENHASLKEFCESVVYLDKQKRKLQRLQERRRRALNPQNYNSDGTIKKGRLQWTHSKRYIKTRDEIAEKERVLAARRKHSHNYEANQILCSSDQVKIEKLSYKAFQKLYGRSVGRKAPSMFVSTLKEKMKRQGGSLQEFSTYKTKLSQTCHCGIIKKKKLSQRWHKCECGVEAQRDLYSAFLAKCVTKSGNLSFNRANKLWPTIKPLLDEAIEDLKKEKKERKLLSSFGI